MADHFGNEILFIVVSVTLIVLLLSNTLGSFSETQLEVLELTETTTFDESWTATGENYRSLDNENLVPHEFFLLFVLPLIILVAYIILKTAGGLLPNWLSGG
jgi:hypothetical protein